MWPTSPLVLQVNGVLQDLQDLESYIISMLKLWVQVYLPFERFRLPLIGLLHHVEVYVLHIART